MPNESGSSTKVVGVAAAGAYEMFSVMGMQAAPWKALLPQSSDDSGDKDDSEGEAAPTMAMRCMPASVRCSR